MEATAEPIRDVLKRNREWVTAAKNALIEVSYADVEVDQISVLQRQAYDAFRRGNYEQSTQLLQDAADSSVDPLVKGWLLEQAAEALNRIDKAGSQALLAAAGDKNLHITKPLAGISRRSCKVLQMISPQCCLRPRDRSRGLAWRRLAHYLVPERSSASSG
jgi:hypothetical protein